MIPIPWSMPEPVTYLPDAEVNVPNKAVRATLRGLCRRAGVVLRATTPDRQIWVYYGSKQVRTQSMDLVAVPRDSGALRSRIASVRALEALAYGFRDHSARACVCKQGLFK